MSRFEKIEELIDSALPLASLPEAMNTLVGLLAQLIAIAKEQEIEIEKLKEGMVEHLEYLHPND